ncbi:hypothetical protein Dsin_023110 [Dipteronia sinensis]|uniref:MULE transposase domain-containing protein n=1 Tax=Dipteronia sinensis TaxID=43782 RepID=A0AAE0A2R8_9ROSI|nr:hypothetical protein Dsin_023110 [Dipteronia sinensis]
MYVSKNMTYEELVSIVHTVVKYDLNKCSVNLQSISIVLGATCRTFLRTDDDVQFMLGEDRVIPQVCVRLTERAAGDVIGNDIPPPENTQQFGSAAVATKCSHKGVPPKYNGQYNEMYNNMNNEQTIYTPNLGLNQEVDNETNIDLIDHVENNDEEHVQILRRRRPVQGVSCTGAAMADTYEVQNNVFADDSDNTTKWVIPGADSYSFGIGRSRTLVIEEPTSMIYKGQFFPTKKDLKRLVGFFTMRQNFEWKVKMSNKTTLNLVCLIDNCTWKLRAVMRDEGTYFQGPHLEVSGGAYVLLLQLIYPFEGKILGYNVCCNSTRWKQTGGALGYIDDLVFISNRHAIIEAGISKVFPYATHTICCCHFAENVKKRFHRKDVAAIMDKVARAYTALKYNRYMGELRNLHKNAFYYVEAAGPYKWSHEHCR